MTNEYNLVNALALPLIWFITLLLIDKQLWIYKYNRKSVYLFCARFAQADLKIHLEPI